MIDLHNDELEESKDLSNKIIGVIDGLWDSLGLHPESVEFAASNNAVDAEQAKHITFFKTKKIELDQYVKDHPELLS
jgi:hypothetical protein